MVKDREDEVAEAENEVWKLQIKKEQHFLQALFFDVLPFSCSCHKGIFSSFLMIKLTSLRFESVV